MSRKQHQKQLARARAKRQAEQRLARRQRTIRWIAIVAIVAMLATLLLALVANRGDPPVPNVADDPAQAGPCDHTPPPGAGEEKPQWDAAPEMQLDPAASYAATMETSCGTVEIELFAADAPIAVNSFVFLARAGFYEGIGFHRVIPGFMIQGGDPLGTGTGGPGYRFEDELDTVAQYGFPRGVLAMANAGPNTNGSQFFVVQGPGASHLETHTVFGRVTSGLEVVDLIAEIPTDAGDRPVEPVFIHRVTIHES